MTDEGVARRFGILGRKSESVCWDELQEVRFDTTDSGPLAEDVFLVLMGGGGSCTIPQDSMPEGLLDRLQALPGFDNEALIQAMGSTENQSFVCWRS